MNHNLLHAASTLARYTETMFLWSDLEFVFNSFISRLGYGLRLGLLPMGSFVLIVARVAGISGLRRGTAIKRRPLWCVAPKGTMLYLLKLRSADPFSG